MLVILNNRKSDFKPYPGLYSNLAELAENESTEAEKLDLKKELFENLPELDIPPYVDLKIKELRNAFYLYFENPLDGKSNLLRFIF